MKIGILGSRGIPNRYGGFEQFAEYLSVGLVEHGWDVWVYNSHVHPYQKKQYKRVNLIHCFDAEDKIGSAGQFIYDLNCIRDSRKRDFDIIFQLGYTSSSVWHRFLPKHAIVVTNMDGLEWKRSKYSSTVRKFLKYAEKLAIKSSHTLVADSEAIAGYLKEEYGVPAEFIPYGAEIFKHPDIKMLSQQDVQPKAYYLVIARMQPDNHVEVIIKGILKSGTSFPLLLIGNTNNSHGRYLVKKYGSQGIRFLGGVFDNQLLDTLRYFSGVYFHGHSAGGTNPSLLEAMAASALICAHDNPFNRSVLGRNSFYFSNQNDIAQLIRSGKTDTGNPTFISNNLRKIEEKYNWKNIIKSYDQLFNKLISHE